MVTSPPYLAMPSTGAIALEAIRTVERMMLSEPHPAVPTEHTFHAGCYARTLRLAPGMVVVTALVKIPTLLIVSGSVDILIDDAWTHLEGHQVIPASAGRKQILLAHSAASLTMVFQTRARTLEEAERAFTDEVDLLLSQRKGGGLCLA